MSFLVENTLSFSRLSKGGWVPRLESVSIAEVANSATEEARELSSRSVTLQVTTASTVVRADPELLRLLFRNLAVNAIAYNRRDPICISVDAKVLPGGNTEVLVSDNGVGIAPHEWQRVFDEYFRGEAGALARGSGLGLALCQTIMRLHQGSLAVKHSDNNGTTFTLRFS